MYVNSNSEMNKRDFLSHINNQSKTSGMKQGQHKIPCPSCQNDRTKNTHDKPLSVNIDSEKVVYHCHHCGTNGLIPRTEGTVMNVVKSVKKIEPIKPKAIPKNDLDSKSAKWLESRHISPQVAEKFSCVISEKNNKPVIGFSFESKGEIEAVKYRSADDSKAFWWDGNAQKLWGKVVIDNSVPTMGDAIIITEGEMDTLAIQTAFDKVMNVHCYSVPNGAPNKITDNKIDPSEDGRFKYVWNDREKFDGVDRVILCTDSDENGNILADELSRRLNKARCYRVDTIDCKDANDVLIKHGAEKLREIVLGAEPIPLHGLNNLDHYADEFQSLYEKGMPTGVSTGYPTVDKIFTLSTPNLVVVTGYPGDGKSAFIDQLIVNVARNSGWRTCYCSFEKPVQLHAVQLSQLLVGKPFFEGQNVRMNQEEKDYAQSWIKEHILFQDYQDGGMPTIENILEKGASAVMRYGVRILVIDPFNFIQNDTKTGLGTDVVSDMLTKVQLFAKQHEVLVFFVAHPTKPFVRDGKKNVCTGVDVSGSMAWFSKADTGLTIYRSEEGVEVHNWKARWGWQGKLGSANMTFNPVNGRYAESEVLEDNFDWEF